MMTFEVDMHFLDLGTLTFDADHDGLVKSRFDMSRSRDMAAASAGNGPILHACALVITITLTQK